ncbi:MAG TPA: hypothetical protein PKW35_04485 [Nannocystaceae bacterium]|nr:hypothetical protein [Nannocystaceae bacterium]
MTDLAQLRAELFKTTGTFVDKLRAASDREPLREEAFQRILDLARYASVDGRRAFLSAMKLPGADAERRRIYDIYIRAGKSETTCQAEAEKLPLFRDLFDAYPPTTTIEDWWDAPVSHLIATYDPANPPAELVPEEALVTRIHRLEVYLDWLAVLERGGVSSSRSACSEAVAAAA